MVYQALTTPQPNDQVTKELLTIYKNNFDFFRTPPKAMYSPSVAAPNITTTSVSFVPLTGFSVNFVTQGGLVLMMLNGRANGTTARFDFLMDGLGVTADSDGVGAPGATGEISILRLLAPAAGSRTFSVSWRVTSGTGTVYPAGLCQLIAWEVFLP